MGALDRCGQHAALGLKILFTQILYYMSLQGECKGRPSETQDSHFMSIKYDLFKCNNHSDDDDDGEFAASILSHTAHALTLFTLKDVFGPFLFLFPCEIPLRRCAPLTLRASAAGACAPAPAQSCRCARSRRAGRQQQFSPDAIQVPRVRALLSQFNNTDAAV